LPDRRLQPYRGVLLLFAAFVAVQAVSAAVLFTCKVGLSPEAVEKFYLGSQEAFARPKSLAGLLEVAVPHLLAIPLVIFITSHLVGWLGLIRRDAFGWFVRISFGSALLGIAAGFGVRYVWSGLAWAKIAGFLCLEGMLLVWLTLVLRIAFGFRRQDLGMQRRVAAGAPTDAFLRE
jgi:hypothetical protein